MIFYRKDQILYLSYLIRFRRHPIAVTADIEKAFHMIKIEKSDRDVLRFLWFSDPFNTHSEVEHFRFTRLVFRLRPSPAILGEVIQKHCNQFAQQHPEIVKRIAQSLYVDDLIAGERSLEEAFNLYQVAKRLMAKGGEDSTFGSGIPTHLNSEN